MSLKDEFHKDWIPLGMFKPSYDVLHGDDRFVENIELLDYAGRPFAMLVDVVDLDANVRGDFERMGDKIVGFEFAIAYRVVK